MEVSTRSVLFLKNSRYPLFSPPILLFGFRVQKFLFKYLIYDGSIYWPSLCAEPTGCSYSPNETAITSQWLLTLMFSYM